MLNQFFNNTLKSILLRVRCDLPDFTMKIEEDFLAGKIYFF